MMELLGLQIYAYEVGSKGITLPTYSINHQEIQNIDDPQ
jgi:hypothetical protein